MRINSALTHKCLDIHDHGDGELSLVILGGNDVMLSDIVVNTTDLIAALAQLVYPPTTGRHTKE